ncbi:MAG TPA: hypothetical protein VN153_12750 [Tahibacter sp.]|nr:hypothetical protein [Tahibacter sp.]
MSKAALQCSNVVGVNGAELKGGAVAGGQQLAVRHRGVVCGTEAQALGRAAGPVEAHGGGSAGGRFHALQHA